MNQLTEMDSVQFEVSCGINALIAIHTAMEEGSSPAEEFVDALLFAVIHLKQKNDEMRKLIDQAFKEKRKEAAA